MNRFFKIFSYIKEYKLNMVLYFLFILLSIVFSLFSLSMLSPFMDLIFGNKDLVQPVTSIDPTATANVTNNLKDTLYNYLGNIVKNNGKEYTLGLICIFIVVMILLKNVFLYLSYYVLAPVRYSISKKYNIALYDKILKLPISFFSEQKKGDILSRAGSDVLELENSVTAAMESIIKDPLNIIGILIFLFFLSFKLTLFVFIFLPISGFIVGRIGKSLKKQTSTAQIKWGEIISNLEETLSGLRIIKAFNAEAKMKKRSDGLTNEMFVIKTNMQYRRDIASPLSEFLGICIVCGVLWFGGRLVLTGQIMSPGAFITYVAIFSQIINPAKALSSAYYHVQKGAATLDRLNEILLAPITVDDNDNGKKLQSFEHAIEFKNVSFSYNERMILNNINLIIPKGKTIALVGSSGAGKSTLADLVPRFHDVTSGEILIDGVNIKDYSLQSIRDKISIVTQEPILFNDTIANNISLGNQTAPFSEIEEAARIANAHQFITKKDGGFNSNIGDRGGKLSGGERQRLTIARAVLKNPPILILDEATSSLDTESERLVQDAINNMMQNRTSIVIAHRLSTIRTADEIVVLQNGSIVERGTHDELIIKDGFYNKLVQMQEVK
jgi:subfamily B ATP-binding cassette protein MsbA